jgi:hypothetical protein
MKLRNFKQLGTAAILTAVLALNSCQKEEVIAPKKPTTTVKAPADIAAATFGKVDLMQNDIMKLAYALTDPNFHKAEGILSCATITRDEVSMPHHAVIDYGSGCTDGDGVLRTGRVDVYYNFTTKTELRNTAGASVSVTFTNFAQGDITYDGTAALTNQGHGGDNHNVFEISVNATVTDAAASETVLVNGSNAFEFTRGYETSDRNDDALSVTGSLSGDINGQSYTAAITGSNPLIKYRMESCNQFYVKGEMVYTYASDPTEYIDYGDGTCDDQAVKTVNGSSQTITLQSNRPF